jgi:hypothetical protein
LQPNDHTVVFVQPEWNGWRTAEIRLGDLQDLHWWQPRGAPRALVHGYISCPGVTSGAIAHDCEGTAAPHRLLVCVLKKHNLPSIYADLARRADREHDPAPAVVRPFMQADSSRSLFQPSAHAGQRGGPRNSRAMAIPRRM